MTRTCGAPAPCLVRFRHRLAVLLKKGSECFESLSMNGFSSKISNFFPFVTSINSVQTFYDTCQVLFIFFKPLGVFFDERCSPGDSFPRTAYDHATSQR